MNLVAHRILGALTRLPGDRPGRNICVAQRKRSSANLRAPAWDDQRWREH